jgi:hypothetical protein
MRMLDPLTLIVLTFAVARVTRLIVDDKISLPIRQRVLQKSGEDGWFFYLVSCPWCMGVWVAAGMTTVTYLWQSSIWATMLTLLAVAQVASTILTMTPTITIKKDE